MTFKNPVFSTVVILIGCIPDEYHSAKHVQKIKVCKTLEIIRIKKYIKRTEHSKFSAEAMVPRSPLFWKMGNH